MSAVDFVTAAENNEEMHNKVSKIIDPTITPKAMEKMYDDWAKNYSEDTTKISYKCPMVATEQLEKVVTNKNAKILDIGAGTGLLGVQLSKAGYKNIDAVEPSARMLDEADKCGVYKRLIVDFVGKNCLDVEDGTYDVIIGTGCFVPGHIKAEAFEELHRITKPGGVFVFVVSSRYYEPMHSAYTDELDKGIQDFIDSGKWVRESHTVVPNGYFEQYNALISIFRIK